MRRLPCQLPACDDRAEGEERDPGDDGECARRREQHEAEADDKEDPVPYYERHLLQEREELIKQLQLLGLSADAIHHLRTISPSGTLNAVSATDDDEPPVP